MQRNELGARSTLAPLAERQSEVLFEISNAKLGALQLGRLLKGNDAGRLVALRSLPGKPSAELASATDLARSLAHPKLAKVLGIVRDPSSWYVASEYISGVTLFELSQTVMTRGTPLEPAVAVRIVLDALKAAADAQRLLAETAQLHGVCCLYAESIWIAEFGEVFLAELLIAPLLAEARGYPNGAERASSAEAQDARSALSELLDLLDAGAADARISQGRSDIPDGLRAVFERANGPHGASAYGTLQALIDDLARLEAQGLVASEQQVSQALTRVMGLVLERRHQKLDMLERHSLQPTEEDATRFFRVAVTTEQGNTTRPPPAPAGGSRPPRRSEPAEEPTALFRTAPPGVDPKLAAPTRPESEQPDSDSVINPISAVWRQARALLDSPARSAKQRQLRTSLDQMPNLVIEPPRFVAAPTPPLAPVAAGIATAKKACFALLLMLLVAGLLYAWRNHF